MRNLLVLVALTSFWQGSRGMDITPVPSGGRAVLAAAALPDFRVSSDGPRAARAALIALTHAPVRQAWKLETLQQPADPWKFQLQTPSSGAVKTGDLLWARFFIRSSGSLNETGEGHTTFVFETADDAHTKSIDLTVSAGDEWREFCFPFISRSTLAAGDALVSLRAGFRPQTIEIGGVEVWNYGPGKKADSLPRTKVDYPGRAIDAPWRQEAADRIEKIRKGDFTVKVVAANGDPVPGAQVELKLRRHAFGFGSAIDSSLLLGDGPDSEKYRDVIDLDFSRVVFENELKWHSRAKATDAQKARSIASFDWFQQRGIAMRGHVLLWPSWQYLPDAVRRAKDNPNALRQMTMDRVEEMVSLTRGRFHDWDVINEPFAHHDLMDILGDQVMVDWFKQARAIDPAVTLFLNDYAGLAAGGMNTQHKDHFEKTARYLIKQGAPIGGIGLQCHFGWSVTPPELALKELDRWGSLGLEIHLTEFDIDTTDEQLQADYTRDLLTLAFSHPSVTAVMTWGFWEGRHWRPDAALFRKDWSLKPNGKAWLDLTTREWWTDATGKTDPAGQFHPRGFFGNYGVTVRVNGTEVRSTIQLTKNNPQATVTIH